MNTLATPNVAKSVESVLFNIKIAFGELYIYIWSKNVSHSAYSWVSLWHFAVNLTGGQPKMY